MTHLMLTRAHALHGLVVSAQSLVTRVSQHESRRSFHRRATPKASTDDGQVDGTAFVVAPSRRTWFGDQIERTLAVEDTYFARRWMSESLFSKQKAQGTVQQRTGT